MSAEGPEMPIACDERLELIAVPGLPILSPGEDLPARIGMTLEHGSLKPRPGDVLVVASKVVSRAEDRFADLSTVTPTPRAEDLAHATGKDPRLVELILRESCQVSRAAPDVLVVRHRLGFVTAHAGIDASNARPADAPPGSGPWVLLLPESPDDSARRIRLELERRFGAGLAVVVSDSFGRPFRLGTVGAAIGASGLPALWDRRGETDLFGRRLEHTITALADQVAAAADLVAGQAAEGRGLVLVRGLRFPPGEHSASELLRLPHQDLYA